MGDPRVIKKYPNRRLYDTAESRYITLNDIRGLVRNRVDFQVIDKRTLQDITRSILLQVISEQEHHDPPLLSIDFLSRVIRCYGAGQHSAIGQHLEESLRGYLQQHPQRDGDKAIAAAQSAP